MRNAVIVEIRAAEGDLTVAVAPERLQEAFRFLARVRLGAKGTCWEWIRLRKLKRGVNTDDYGSFHLLGERVPVDAHRAAWQLFVGAIPSGQHVLHTCDNPACVNWRDHLILGTPLDNVIDKVQKGRQSRGETAGPAKLTVAQVRNIRAQHASGRSQRSLAREFGVDSMLVNRIVRRKLWRHV